MAAEPDLYLSLGDAIYGDFDGEKTFDVTPESLRAEWQKLADHPDWKQLVDEVPVMATWDNHDYGHHSAGEVRLIASSGQIVPNQKGMDEWGNYPHERQRLFDLIDSTGAEGVVLLTGNVHFSEASLTGEGPYPLHDFTASGLTHVNEEYPQAPNDYRIAGPYVDLNFGLIEIDRKADPSPLITFRVIDTEGDAQLEHTVALSELRPGVEDSIE